MSPTAQAAAAPPVYPRPLSDLVYDTSPNDPDHVIDRLCNVVQVLVECQPRLVQLAVLEALQAPYPHPNQQELFS